MFELGFQHGEKLKSRIDYYIDWFLTWYRTKANMQKDQVLRETRKYASYIEQYSSEISEELRGIAEGAGKKLDEILFLNLCTVYVDQLSAHYDSGARACTSFAATGQASIKGLTYIGQTDDASLDCWGEANYALLLHKKPSKGPEILTYTSPGVPGVVGLNSEGIAVCLNALISEETRVGVPTFPILSYEVLRRKTVLDGIEAIATAKRANSGNFLIADKHGEVYDVEVTPSAWDSFYVEDYMAHSNHFLSKKLPIKEDRILMKSVNTITRYNRMNKLLRQNFGQIDDGKMKTFATDHINFPNSVCRHIDNTVPQDKKNQTYNAVIFSPSTLEMWFACGHPCENQFQEYRLTLN